jgi:hypothetical protein
LTSQPTISTTGQSLFYIINNKEAWLQILKRPQQNGIGTKVTVKG